MSTLPSTDLRSTGLLKELWVLISMDNPTTYYKLLQVSKVFKLDTDYMKAKFIRVVNVDNTILYILPNGWIHSCDNKPAVIRANGNQCWYYHGKRHRDGDQPAITYANGNQAWFINDIQHRENDKPAVICANGSQLWYARGELHRDNNQPAVIYADGKQYWYIDGKKISQC